MRAIILLLLLCGHAWGQAESAAPAPAPAEKKYDFGWVNDPPSAARVAAQLKVYGEQVQALPWRDDITALDYVFLCKAMNVKILPSLDQGKVGSCVGFATTRAAGITAAADILHRGEPEQWLVDFSPDALYAIGRQAAGRLGAWDGSTGAWAVDGLQKIGTLHRKRYDDADLTEYNEARTREWARQGLPGSLLDLAKEHLFLSAAPVTTVEQAKASLQNGYPLIVCSMISYPNKRDELGFLPATGERWAHAMCCAAYRAASTGREGFLILNSWRAPAHNQGWVTGPIWPPDTDEYPQPLGSFWVTPQDFAKHLSFGDTWAVSGYQGFRKRDIDWTQVFSQAGGKERE